IRLPVLAIQEREPGLTNGDSELDFDRRGATEVSLRGVRVLVVDDDHDARELVKRLLTEHDAEVQLARSADEPLQLLSKDTTDILLSDIGMPGMDGYDLIRAVRELPA